MMKTWVTLILLSILFTGCNSGVATDADETATGTKQVLSQGNQDMKADEKYTILNSGQYPEVTAGEQERHIYHSDVASDVEKFEKEYLALTDKVAPSFEGTVIIAKMGEQTTGGYTIKVESVKDAGRFTELTLVSNQPGQFATTALTNPYIIVLLPNNHKDVTIIEK